MLGLFGSAGSCGSIPVFILEDDPPAGRPWSSFPRSMRPGSWCFFARSSPRSLILSSVPGGGYRSRSPTITSFLDVRGLRFTRVSLKVIRRIDFARRVTCLIDIATCGVVATANCCGVGRPVLRSAWPCTFSLRRAHAQGSRISASSLRLRKSLRSASFVKKKRWSLASSTTLPRMAALPASLHTRSTNTRSKRRPGLLAGGRPGTVPPLELLAVSQHETSVAPRRSRNVSAPCRSLCLGGARRAPRGPRGLRAVDRSRKSYDAW